MTRILLVEDDPTICRTLSAFLEGDGFAVTLASGEEAAVRAMDAEKPELALVDLCLEQGDGFGVFREAKKRDLGVIFLTASGDEYSVSTGLDMGAEDYVAKPFRPRELVARIRAALRRRGSRQVIRLGELTVDTERAAVTRAGQELYLSALEYRLLLVFLNNRGRVLSRARLLEEIWDSAGEFVEDNTLTVYIKRLRDKIEADPQDPRLIKTVRGLGYRLEG